MNREEKLRAVDKQLVRLLKFQNMVDSYTIKNLATIDVIMIIQAACHQAKIASQIQKLKQIKITEETN